MTVHEVEKEMQPYPLLSALVIETSTYKQVPWKTRVPHQWYNECGAELAVMSTWRILCDGHPNFYVPHVMKQGDH